MTKRYLRTEKDFIIESISWLTENVDKHTQAGFTEIPKHVIHRRFNQLVNFLHLKGLSTLNLIDNIEQVNAINELKNSDLNDKGFYFLQSCLDKWLGRLYKDNGADKEWKYLEKWYASFEKTYE
jgi:hypothetical protein